MGIEKLLLSAMFTLNIFSTHLSSTYNRILSKKGVIKDFLFRHVKY